MNILDNYESYNKIPQSGSQNGSQSDFLYNLSLALLVTGIILLTIYITKINIKENKEDYLRRKPNAPDIYDLRPNEVFRKMFNQAPIMQKYQDYDEADETGKLYIK
jgi:hypothetical protein